jgi:hypothetical protein
VRIAIRIADIAIYQVTLYDTGSGHFLPFPIFALI